MRGAHRLRKYLFPLGALIVSLMALVVLMMMRHTDWQDVTKTRYNGYKPGAIFRLRKPMRLAHFPTGLRLHSNYYITQDTPAGPFTDGELPVGTRIRFDEALWAPSHEGPGGPVAFGTILDPPFESRYVSLLGLTERADRVGRAQPNPSLLSQDER